MDHFASHKRIELCFALVARFEPDVKGIVRVPAVDYQFKIVFSVLMAKNSTIKRIQRPNTILFYWETLKVRLLLSVVVALKTHCIRRPSFLTSFPTNGLNLKTFHFMICKFMIFLNGFSIYLVSLVMQP